MSDTIQNIRALMWQFQRASLLDFYLRKDGLSLFLASSEGGANPMLAPPAPAAVVAPPVPGLAISAPHLGLFEPCFEVGETVAAGAIVARIDVLGRKTDVVAKSAGKLISVGFAANDLVEFGDRLLEVEPA